jgi:hypothetical protein
MSENVMAAARYSDRAGNCAHDDQTERGEPCSGDEACGDPSGSVRAADEQAQAEA